MPDQWWENWTNNFKKIAEYDLSRDYGSVDEDQYMAEYIKNNTANFTSIPSQSIQGARFLGTDRGQRLLMFSPGIVIREYEGQWAEYLDRPVSDAASMQRVDRINEILRKFKDGDNQTNIRIIEDNSSLRVIDRASNTLIGGLNYEPATRLAINLFYLTTLP